MERDESPQRVLSDFARPSALAPFRIRNYRFQWPADLLTSWAFEMEMIILGWYVLNYGDSALNSPFPPTIARINRFPARTASGHACLV